MNYLIIIIFLLCSGFIAEAYEGLESDFFMIKAKKKVVRTKNKQTTKTCCKVCSKGRACGNSCISVNKICHKAPGCAC